MNFKALISWRYDFEKPLSSISYKEFNLLPCQQQSRFDLCQGDLSRKIKEDSSRGRTGVLGLILLGMCRWSLRAATPLQYILWPIIDPILVTFGQICNFRHPNVVTFYLCIYLILNEESFIFHLHYKHSGTFANRKYEELSSSKNPKLCDPILVILLKMRPHYNQSSCENATPSSGTSPLASYREVPQPPAPLPTQRLCSQGINLIPE